MKLDLTKIDEKIRMLQTIRNIASDPEMAGLLETVIDRNGAAPAPPAATSLPRHPGVRHPKHKQAFVRGALKAAVVDAIHHRTTPFSAYDLTADIQAKGDYVFTASSPAIAVNDVLRTLLRKKQEIRLYHKGKGGIPHRYSALKSTAPDTAEGMGRGQGD
jgi:hypothetical protein